MKKLLITTDNYLPRWDGIARFLSEIIPRLTKQYEITIIAPEFGPVLLPKHTRLIAIPLSRFKVGDYPIPKFQYKRIKSQVENADIIFNQTLGPIGISTIRASKKLKKKIITYTHSLEWELVPKSMMGLKRKFSYPFVKFFSKLMYNSMDALLVPSDNIADKLTWLGIRTKKRIVHLGVDETKFKPGNKEQIRKSLKLPKKDIIIGYHGRLANEKNLITLLRAFLRLPVKNKKLLIVGDGLETIKHKLKKRNVILAGQQENVIPWLQAMDFYVMPSFTETTCLSVLEAMASGLIVISTPVGFVKQYIKDGKNGFFFDFSSYDLYQKLNMAINFTYAQGKEIRDAAMKTVTQSFSWNNAAKKIGQYLEELQEN